MIERKIGTGAFGAMAIDADWRDAAWGERHGLYARVVDDTATLDAEVDRVSPQLAAANPEARDAHQARTCGPAPTIGRASSRSAPR